MLNDIIGMQNPEYGKFHRITDLVSSTNIWWIWELEECKGEVFDKEN